MEPGTIPALVRDNPLDVFFLQLVMEVKPPSGAVTAGNEDQMFQISKDFMATPDTSVEDYVDAEQGSGRLREVSPFYSRTSSPTGVPRTTVHKTQALLPP
ncbi:hypothetical protein [Arthrobacter sp. ISL-69]|uniref:hypothetical protein n=1 Tax=Arthrobacter sp. ISL-69 TaxID=2819113 RepID=UPI001BECE14D|nr:hypothetical protein [Arthrobacter sp. ISL-69]MBT2538974.1 hypothetical protein [Arthrobacter sp. ISL-69]